jgi:hypothetical protein
VSSLCRHNQIAFMIIYAAEWRLRSMDSRKS